MVLIKVNINSLLGIVLIISGLLMRREILLNVNIFLIYVKTSLIFSIILPITQFYYALFCDFLYLESIECLF